MSSGKCSDSDSSSARSGSSKIDTAVARRRSPAQVGGRIEIDTAVAHKRSPAQAGGGSGIDTAVAHVKQAEMTELKDEHINETTPGMPAVMHPTVVAAFVAVDNKSRSYAVNCNQAAPDETKMFKMQSSLAGINNVGNGTLNDSKMALFLSIKPDKDDENADEKDIASTVSTFHTSTTGSTGGGVHFCTPFKPLAILNKLVNSLNGSSENDKEVQQALRANLTTVKGQKELFDVAVKHEWLDANKTSTVKIAEDDGYEEYVIFQLGLNNALLFHASPIEGNNRINAAKNSLLKCKAKSNSPTKACNTESDHYLSSEYLGVKVDADKSTDAMSAVFDSLVKDDGSVQLNQLLNVDIMVSKKDATDKHPASNLIATILVGTSKLIADTKHDSSKSNFLTHIVSLLGKLHTSKSENDQEISTGSGNLRVRSKNAQSKPQPIDGTTQNGRAKLLKLQDDVFSANAFIAEFLEDPVRRLDKAIGGIRVKGHKNDTTKRITLPAALNLTNISTVDVKVSMKEQNARIIGPVILKTVSKYCDCDEFTGVMIAELLLGGLFYNSKTFKLNLNSKYVSEEASAPKAFENSPLGDAASVSSFLVEWMAAANVYDNATLLRNTLDTAVLEAGATQMILLRTFARANGLIAIQTRLLTELLGNAHVPKPDSAPKKTGSNAKDYKVSAVATCIRLALTYEWMTLYLRGGSNPKFNDTLSNDDVKQKLNEAVRRYLFNDNAELDKKKTILDLAKNAIKNLTVSDKHASKGKIGVSNSVDKDLKWYLTYSNRTTNDLPSRLEICQMTFITNLLRKKEQYSDSKLAEFLYGNRVFHIRDGALAGNKESDPFEIHDDGVAPRRLNSPCDYVPTTNLANDQEYIDFTDTYEAFFGNAGVDATVRATKIVTHATTVNANEPSTTGTEDATIQESPAEDTTKRGAPDNLDNAAEEGNKRAKTGNDIAAQADSPSESDSINDIAAQADTPSASASTAMVADESTVCTMTSSFETVSKGLKETFLSQGFAIDDESSKSATRTFMKYIKENTDMIGNDDNDDASFMENEDHDGDVTMLDIDVKGYYFVNDDHDLELQDAVKRAYQYSKHILSNPGGGKVVLARLKADEIQTMYNWEKDTIDNGTTVDMAIRDIANKLERNIKVITRNNKNLFEEEMYNVKDAKDTLFILRMDMSVNGNASNENTRYTSLRKNPCNKEDSNVDVESSSGSLENGTDHEGWGNLD